MAAHRSPRGRRALPAAGPTRHRVAHRPPHTGPSPRIAVVASAAAVGAVATGTFTALVPVAEEGAAAAADATENPVSSQLVASTTSSLTTAAGASAFQPVAYELDAADGGTIAEEHLTSLDKAGRLADELAEQRAAQERERAEQARLDTLIAEGGLDGWVAEALRVLELPQSLAPSVKKIVMAESGGNPRAINNWDSNASRGNPSQGLMQTIPSTFRAYVHPAMADESITHPVANLTAGIRYMIDNYGMDTLETGGRSNGSGGYVGY